MTAQPTAFAERVRAEPSLDPEVRRTIERIAERAAAGKSVLVFGARSALVAKELRERGATVTVAEPAARGGELGGVGAEERFDVVVVSQLEAQDDPALALARAKAHLGPEGSVVASARNASHAAVRLALLRGESENGGGERRGQVHGRRTLEALFERAGLLVGHVDRVERPLDDASPADEDAPEAVSTALAEAVLGAPDALTGTFVVTAYAAGDGHLGHVHARVRELVDAREAAERRAAALSVELDAARRGLRGDLDRELEELRAALARKDDDLRTLERQVAAGPAREVELRSMLLDAHDRLARRDQELKRLRDEEVKKLKEQLHLAINHIRWVETTRAWRWSQAYRKMRDRFRGLLS